jgi:methyl-accepting chemotaxis protein
MVRKTRKYKRYKSKNKLTKFSKNKYGGEPPKPQVEDNPNIQNPESKENDELMKKIEDSHSLNNLMPNFSLGDSKIMKGIVNLSEALAMQMMDKTAQFFNLDLNDSEKFKQRLEELKVILDDPENKKLMRELMGNFSELGVISLEASAPFIEKLIIEIFEKLTVMGNEFGKAGLKIALNTLTEVPGYGIIVGSIRSASNAGEAVLASTNAASEIITTTSDNINAAVQNFDKLLKEKQDVIDRTAQSIDSFSNNMKNMPNNIQQQKGGKKTKKNVRFNI